MGLYSVEIPEVKQAGGFSRAAIENRLRGRFNFVTALKARLNAPRLALASIRDF